MTAPGEGAPRVRNDLPPVGESFPEAVFSDSAQLNALLGRSIPPHLSVAEMQLEGDNPEIDEKFARSVRAIALLDTLAARDDAVANPDAVNLIIDAITVNAAYAAAVDGMPLTTLGQQTAKLDTYERYPAVIARRPDRVIELLGGIKRHNPPAYRIAYETAALRAIDEMHSPSREGSLALKQLGGRIDVVIAVEVASGATPDEALAALRQHGHEMSNFYSSLFKEKPES